MGSLLVIIIAAVVAAFVFALGVLVGGRAAIAMKRAFDRELERKDQAHTEDFGRAIDERLALERELAEQKALVANEVRRRREVVECVAVVEKERNTWKEMYFRTGLGHSAAQNMLMREITRLSLLCKRAGIKNGEIDPNIQRVVREFDEQNVAPIRAEKGGGIKSGSPVEKPSQEG